jgi:hypothetical protein
MRVTVVWPYIDGHRQAYQIQRGCGSGSSQRRPDTLRLHNPCPGQKPHQHVRDMRPTLGAGAWTWRQRCPSPRLRPAGKWLICQRWSGDNPTLMITLLLHRLRLFPFLCGGHRQLALENLALRQQLAV